jgi:beta-phosphoglucomutase-like phosphatase (HAD superfamily)
MAGDQLVAAVAGKRVEAWTTSADLEQTKPDPDLVHTAIEKVGGGEAARRDPACLGLRARVRG